MTDANRKPVLTVRQWAFRFIAGVFACALLALGLVIVQKIANHNFQTVSKGLLYRSAQMDGPGFRQTIRENGIKSIINLRGLNHEEWYNAETNAAQELGVAHYDFALSASQQLNNLEMEKIVAMLANAPKPILIHCKNGADRSGLVGSLYLYTQEGCSAEVAERELSVSRGHFPYLFWHDTIAMDDSFARFTRAHLQSGSIVLTKD